MVVIGLYVFVALAAPLIAPFDPYAYSARPYEAPSARHLLGANDVGQDVLSELFYGTRVSLAVALFAGASAVLIGAAVGLLAGSRRGIVDAVAMRIVDVFLTLPRLPLIIVVAAYLGGGTLTIIGILVFFAWPSTARIVRSQALSVSRLEYVQAARAIGAGELHVIRRHLIPVTAPILAAAFVSNAGRAVLLESGLAFLGLGDATVKSWGAMLFFALRLQRRLELPAPAPRELADRPDHGRGEDLPARLTRPAGDLAGPPGGPAAPAGAGREGWTGMTHWSQTLIARPLRLHLREQRPRDDRESRKEATHGSSHRLPRPRESCPPPRPRPDRVQEGQGRQADQRRRIPPPVRLPHRLAPGHRSAGAEPELTRCSIAPRPRSIR